MPVYTLPHMCFQAHVSFRDEYEPQSAKMDLGAKNFKNFALNSSLGLVADVQSENIGEKQEYLS